jgi:hypothetical protein
MDRSSITATIITIHEEVTTLVRMVLVAAVASEDHLLGGETVAEVVIPGTFTALPVAILAMGIIEGGLRISIRTVEGILLQWTTTLPVAIIRLPAFVIATTDVVDEEIEIDVNFSKIKCDFFHPGALVTFATVFSS